MKTIIKLSFYFNLCLSGFAYAQVTDIHNVAIPSVSTSVTLPNGTNTTLNLTTIDQNYGAISSSNLFHSFSSFNINSSEGVDFTNTSSTAIHNVISRVTGGSVSTIDGLLRSSIAGANFYFINPAGVTFGANAVVDVPAAFHVSTAQKLNFGTDVFDTSIGTTSPPPSILTVADPTSFGFLGKNSSATIKIEGDNKTATLSNLKSKTLDFVANNISIKNAPNPALLDPKILPSDIPAIPASEIRLIAFKGTGNISSQSQLQPDNSSKMPLPNVTPSITNAGNISIDNSVLNSQANGGTRIALWGNDIEIKNQSILYTLNNGAAIDDGIGDAIDAPAVNGIEIYANLLNASGRNTFISTETSGAGDTGHVTVNSNTLNVLDGSRISANTIGVGNAGSVTITSDTVNIKNAGQITSSTFERGKAGNVIVTAKNMNIDGNGQTNNTFTGISSASNSGDSVERNRGNGGTITVISDILDIQNGGAIRTSTFTDGNAGELLSVSANVLKIDGQDSKVLLTGISSRANPNRSNPTISGGDAGTIVVNAGTLEIHNRGQISSSSTSPGYLNLETNEWVPGGDAGKVIVTAGNILLDGNLTNISSAVINPKDVNGNFIGIGGHTGAVSVNASKIIQLHNDSKITIQSDANVLSGAKAIDKSVITVSAPDIDLKDSSITAAATGNDDAGDIVVNFSHWLTMDPSFITTTANTGNGGMITIKGGELIYLQNSGFLTSVSGATSNGGNINVTADALIMETGVIQANAVGGSGGDINIFLKALIPSQNNLILGGSKVFWQPYQPGLNVIQAAAESGVSGAVNVNSPQFDISGSVSGLDTSGLVLPSLGQSLCQSSGSRSSSLTRGSKGGIPVSESKAGFIPSAGVLPNAKSGSEKNASTAKVSAADSVKPQKYYPCAAKSL